MQQRLTAQFPDYDISLEYYHSGDLAAKLQAEGADTACDIVFDCEYGYLQMLSDNFATIDFIDNSQFVADMQDPTAIPAPSSSTRRCSPTRVFPCRRAMRICSTRCTRV